MKFSFTVCIDNKVQFLYGVDAVSYGFESLETKKCAYVACVCKYVSVQGKVYARSIESLTHSMVYVGGACMHNVCVRACVRACVYSVNVHVVRVCVFLNFLEVSDLLAEDFCVSKNYKEQTRQQSI